LQSQRQIAKEHLLNAVSKKASFTRAIVLLLCLPACALNAEHKPKDSECLLCHSDSTLSKDENGRKISLYINADALKRSIHGGILSCVDCHSDVKSSPHETTPAKASCAQCHADEQKAYSQSRHSKASTQGGAPIASCADCHGNAHAILPADEAKSPIHHSNIPITCGACHGQKLLMESDGESAQPFIAYQQSVHGRAIEKGSTKAAVCTDCHRAHDVLPANDAGSPISRFNVPATCGQCHTEIEKAFNGSIHGQAAARGNGMAPVCTDCHGIHSIKAHIDANSPVAEQNLARTTCARCHEGVRLTNEFGVAGNRVSTYLDSYHGLASEDGSTVAANCASCHGVHNILPSSDPRSTINKENLVATCGKCHQGVTQRFTENRVHLDVRRSNDIGSAAMRWVRWIYLWLIAVVIGGMFLHNAIIWRRKAIIRRQAAGALVVRMTPNQRWQHLVLLASFAVLVITGFALKFPNSWFAEMLGMSERLRSIAHRVAGVALIAVGVYHLIYVGASRDGRKLIAHLAPGLRDLRDARDAMLYYLGLRKARPKFGRFSYAEKAEYWALVWGTVLMGVTGIMMWAKVWVGNLLARWWVDVATSIHFYEAILATLAIVVWHFYQVFLDADVYPMNWAWWDGKMPAKHYREEHPLDTETLKTSQDETAASELGATTGDHPAGGDSSAG
jgi:cytochrome b subunit of formate dehydrogenase